MLDYISTAVLTPIQRTAEELGLQIMLIGATARDLLLEQAHNIDARRATRDVDFAVSVRSWEEFERLKKRLVATGHFIESAAKHHRLDVVNSELWIDIIPFDGIETTNRTISWPPHHDIVMNTIGFREAYDSAGLMTVAPGIDFRVISLPGLAGLKIIAWNDRKDQENSRDAHDLAVIAGNYLDAGNRDRLYSELPHLLEHDEFDYVLAGAHLLGHDIKSTLGRHVAAGIDKILICELDPKRNHQLATDMARSAIGADDPFEYCLKLISELHSGITGA